MKLTANQEGTLRTMASGRRGQVWSGTEAHEAWGGEDRPRATSVGMAMRNLWRRGLADRDQGPPSQYKLNAAGWRHAERLDSEG